MFPAAHSNHSCAAYFQGIQMFITQRHYIHAISALFTIFISNFVDSDSFAMEICAAVQLYTTKFSNFCIQIVVL